MRRDQQHDPHVMMAKEGCMKWIAKSVGTALQKKHLTCSACKSVFCNGLQLPVKGSHPTIQVDSQGGVACHCVLDVITLSSSSERSVLAGEGG